MANFKPFTAAGNINPYRIVVRSGGYGVTQAANATTEPVGITQEGTREPPYSSLNDGYAAISPEQVTVFTRGETAKAESGAGVTAGTRVMSDGSGRIITGTATNWTVGVVRQTTAGAGEMVEVDVDPIQLN